MMGRDLTNTTRKTRRHEPAGCLIYALRSGRYRMSVSMGAVAGWGGVVGHTQRVYSSNLPQIALSSVTMLCGREPAPHLSLSGCNTGDAVVARDR